MEAYHKGHEDYTKGTICGVGLHREGAKDAKEGEQRWQTPAPTAVGTTPLSRGSVTNVGFGVDVCGGSPAVLREEGGRDVKSTSPEGGLYKEKT